MKLFSLAFSLALLMDPIGNIPLYIALLKDVKPRRQYFVIFREMIIALVVIIIFNFIGDALLGFLHVDQDTVQIAGGIVLFLIALRMIFPPAKDTTRDIIQHQEPFIFPLAIPFVAGPSILAAVIIYSNQEQSDFLMISAIAIAWLITLIILLLSPLLQRILGSRGIIACERLMGLILILIGIQMLLEGVNAFVHKFL